MSATRHGTSLLARAFSYHPAHSQLDRIPDGAGKGNYSYLETFDLARQTQFKQNEHSRMKTTAVHGNLNRPNLVMVLANTGALASSGCGRKVASRRTSPALADGFCRLHQYHTLGLLQPGKPPGIADFAKWPKSGIRSPENFKITVQHE